MRNAAICLALIETCRRTHLVPTLLLFAEAAPIFSFSNRHQYVHATITGRICLQRNGFSAEQQPATMSDKKRFKIDTAVVNIW